MQSRSKVWMAIAAVIVVAMVGYLGVTGYQLKKRCADLSAAADACAAKSKLLNDKYKEEKASANRAQRAALAIEGQLRQAKMDIDKLNRENQSLLAQKEGSAEKIKSRLAACEVDKSQLIESQKQLTSANAELEGRQRKMAETLNAREVEKKSLNEKVQSLTAGLQQSRQQSERFEAHNATLCSIAQSLVGRLEQKKLGSSVMVKEPLIQFERVELEKLLQEYLDKIDEEKITR